MLIKLLYNTEKWERIYCISVKEYFSKTENTYAGRRKLSRFFREDEPHSTEFLKIWAKNMEGIDYLEELRGLLTKEIEKGEDYKTGEQGQSDCRED